MRGLLASWLLAILVLLPGAACAHKPSDSYLALTVTEARVEGQWDIALRDLDHAIGLDGNGDGAITWGELEALHDAIAAYALNRLTIAADGAACTTARHGHLVADHSDGTYAVLRFAADCPAAIGRLEVGYSLLFDLDPQHRGLLQVTRGGVVESAVLSPDQPVRSFAMNEGRPWRQLADYLREGIWHIWIGYDHILFLLTLLLPAVLARRDRRWLPVEGVTAAFLQAAKIVTAFTAAHSITLSLAALEMAVLPSRLVESMIAASVILAALNNVFPVVTRKLWLVAFGFGLVHGFGFAGVLSDLGLPGGALLISLFGFNLGVELGQLAIVAAFLPLAFLLRDAWFYTRIALPLGSLAVAGVASLWLAERALDLKVPLL